jgi:hypothetical protein
VEADSVAGNKTESAAAPGQSAPDWCTYGFLDSAASGLLGSGIVCLLASRSISPAGISAGAALGGSWIVGRSQLKLERLRLRMVRIEQLYDTAIAYEQWAQRVSSGSSREPNERNLQLREQGQLDTRLRMLGLLYWPEMRPKLDALIAAGKALEHAQARYEAAERSMRAGTDLVSIADRVSKASEAFIEALVRFQAGLGKLGEQHMVGRSWWRRCRSRARSSSSTRK